MHCLWVHIKRQRQTWEMLSAVNRSIKYFSSMFIAEELEDGYQCYYKIVCDRNTRVYLEYMIDNTVVIRAIVRGSMMLMGDAENGIS